MPSDAKNGTSRDNSALNGIKSPEQTVTVAQNLVQAVKHFSSDQGFQDLAELVDSYAELKNGILERDERIRKADEDLKRAKTEHSNEVQTNLTGFGNEYKRLDNEKNFLQQKANTLSQSVEESRRKNSELEKKVEDLKTAGKKIEESLKGRVTKLKEIETELAKAKTEKEGIRKEMAGVKDERKAAQNQASALKQSFDKCKQDYNQLSAELETESQKLEELRNFSVSLQETDEDDVAGRLANTWDAATSLIRSIFSQDLSDDSLLRPWKALDEAAKDLLGISLPRSNSAIAKELRVVAAIGILNELIDKQIFQPTYLLPEESRFRDLLYLLAAREPEKEKFLRGMMLSILPDERRIAEERVVSIALREFLISVGIEEIVPPGSATQFRSGLEEILTNARNIWRAVQYSAYIFGCEFQYNLTPGTHWQEFKFQTGGNAVGADTPVSISGDDPGQDLVVIIPRIFFVEQDRDPEPITTGFVVRKSQIRMMEREERESIRSAEPTSPRFKRRHDSVNERRGSEAFLYRTAGGPKYSNR